VLLVSNGYGWQAPVVSPPPSISFPLDLAIIDPASAEKKPPYIVMFEGGLDDRGRDCRGPLGRLEALRGQSKMFPETNNNDGLPVVLRGLRFHQRVAANGVVLGYDVELQGEFNMVKVTVSEDQMKRFLAGERVVFTLHGEKNYGIFAYVSSVKIDVQLSGEELLIFACAGDFSFREGLRRYTSKTKQLEPPPGRPYLYRGERAPLPTLPAI
jgi:hypothetical protein